MSITDELREFRMNAFSRIDPMALKLLEITNVKSVSSISACCRGDRVSAYGYTWQLKEVDG